MKSLSKTKNILFRVSCDFDENSCDLLNHTHSTHDTLELNGLQISKTKFFIV